MSLGTFLGKLVGSGMAEPIEAVGNILDKVFTSDEERLSKQLLLEKLAQQPHMVQAEINKVEAAHRSIFVAGWRPYLGWVCGAGFTITFVINPLLQWITGRSGPQIPVAIMLELVLGMLGLAGIRTYEKIMGKAK